MKFSIIVPRTRIRRPQAGDVVQVRGFLSGESCGHVHNSLKALRECEARHSPWYTEHYPWEVEVMPGHPRRVRLIREVTP